MSSSSRSKPVALAILPNWLGDLVMAEPALRALARTHEVRLVGHPALAGLLVDGGLAASVIPFDRRGADAGPWGLWRAGRRLRAHRAQRCLVFPPSLRAGVLARLSGARARGFGGEGLRWLLHEARTPLGGARRRHLSDQWLALVDDADVESGVAVPRLQAGPRARAAVDALRATDALPPAGRYVAVAAGATYGPTKRWPREAFAALLRRLREVHDRPAVLVGAAAEAETTAWLAAETGASDLAGRTDLPGLAGVLAEAAAFVGNDSGPMHLAAALGTPTVGIFGSTSPAWTGPRGPWTRVAGPAPVECSPCFLKECPIGLPCLRNLEVDAVEAALRALSDARAGAQARG